MECAIESVSDTEITCVTAEQPSGSSVVYKGGRGLELDIFVGQTDVDADLDGIQENGELQYLMQFRQLKILF